MKFPSKYDHFNNATITHRVFSNHGNSNIRTYKARYSDTGHFDVVLDGSRDIYSDIQSHADSVDIYSILHRFESGAISELPERLSFYGDFSEAKTLADYLNIVREAESEFLKLPVEEREKYDNSAIVWLSTASEPGDSIDPGPDTSVPSDPSLSDSAPAGASGES